MYGLVQSFRAKNQVKIGNLFLQYFPGTIDRGHFFHISPAQGLVFLKHTRNSRIQKLGLFEGLRSRKEKKIETPSFFEQKII